MHAIALRRFRGVDVRRLCSSGVTDLGRRGVHAAKLLVLRACWATLMMGSGWALAAEPALYFDRVPFVHPKVVEDLLPWISDDGEQVVAVNLLETVGRNRYFGSVNVGEVRGNERPFVWYEDESVCEGGADCSRPLPFFGYKLIGQTDSGVYVLLTTRGGGGGSGVFNGLLFLVLEADRGLAVYSEGESVLRGDRERWLLKRLGDVILGDRYVGELSVRGNDVHIGKDHHERSAGFFPEDVVLEIEWAR